jgi:hypothetical protein
LEMTSGFSWRRLGAELVVFVLAAAGIRTVTAAKNKPVLLDPNDATVRLFQILDDTHGGKLSDLYILGEVYKDKNSSKPDQELQHVMMVEYDKNRAFGKLTIHVRTMDKLGPQQLKTYTAKQIYDFGEYDSEKFLKSVPGPFGQPGDVYLRTVGDGPLTDTPITDEIRQAYDKYVNQYIIPSLQKKPDASN